MEHTNVKILAISDVPSKALWDYDTRARLEGIDLILSCGDLPKKYLEYLTNFTAAPILYVHGNHDGSYQTEGEKHLTPTHSEDIAEPFGNIPADSSFDFSALGDLSDQAVETDRQFDLHYGTAQDEYLISCIYVAKMHALTAKAGRYGGGTWTKWYESKGMSKSIVWNMLQTGEGFKGSTVEQLTSIPELSRKDLNLIARSGCAEQLTAAAGCRSCWPNSRPRKTVPTPPKSPLRTLARKMPISRSW